MAWIKSEDPKYREGKKIKISVKIKKEWETKLKDWKYCSAKSKNIKVEQIADEILNSKTETLDEDNI